MKQLVNKPIFMTLYAYQNSTVKKRKKTFLFLGHQTSSISIYPTIYFIKYLTHLFLGHGVTSTSIYPKIHVLKILKTLIPGA